MGTYLPYSQVEIRQVRELAGAGLNDVQIECRTGIPRRRAKGIRTKYEIESPYRASRSRRYRTVLSADELAYLRRLVGFRPGYDYAIDDAGHEAVGA